jgi:hypothetical protein
MNETYFSKMPIITYANTNTRNITERAKIVHTRLVDPNNYYNIEIGDAMYRADVLAYNLYSDSYMDWMMWLNNGVVDPYYSWYLNPNEFSAHITDVYGSMPFAQQKVAYYRTAWPTDNTVRISVSDFQYSLPSAWKKYFQPIYDDYGNILYYTQAYYDWRMSTNQMLQWDIEMTYANTTFATGNVVQVVYGGEVTGQGQIVQANSTVVIAQHISGNTAAPGGLVDAFNNNVSATFSNTTILQTNIPLTEAVFWEGVTYYILEDEANTLRKFISVIDNGIALQVSAAITAEFNA